MSEIPESESLFDKRRSHCFWIDDVVIDQFSHKIGVYGIAVYAYLSRRAKNRKTFPGIRRIASDLRIGHATVKRTLQCLKDENLIDIMARQTDAGDSDTNLYTLNDLSHLWGVPNVSPPVPNVSPPVPNVSLGVGSVGAYGRVCTETKGLSSFKGSHLEEDLRTSSLRSEVCSELEKTSLPAPSAVVGSAEEIAVASCKKAAKPAKKPTKVQPISETDWPGLRTLLTNFGLPVEVLDDNLWWNSLSYTCNVLESVWLEREFARMEAWLNENPKKRPATRWKTFIRGWLERAYEKERKGYVGKKG